MALTMVHLLAGDLWARGHEEYRNSPEFHYGVISPDAIHIRDGNDKSHKDEIHLNNWRSPHPDDVIAYWREHHTPFDIGYGVHVLTDAQWVPRYRERLKGMLLPNGLLDTGIYYNDTFVTDFKLYHETPRLQEILEMIGPAHTPEDHPLLTAHEFSAWRDALIKAYHGECPKSDPVRFVTEAYVLEFVKDSTAMIDEVYARAFGGAGA
ncbi:MAG: hypothetical protein Q4C10_13980 [Clostridia bacterium]|nr:hypothetical protein [Clostridia bacterium]